MGQALRRLEAVEHVGILARRGAIPGAAGDGGAVGVAARVRAALEELLGRDPELCAAVSIP